MEDNISSRPLSFKLLAEKTSDSLNSFTLVKFLPARDSKVTVDISYLDMKDFSGTVYKYNENGVLEAVEGYQDGILQATLTDFSKKPKSTTSARMPLPCDEYTNGQFVEFSVTSHTDWYVSAGSNPWVYVGSTAGFTRKEYEYVPCDQITDPKYQYAQHEHSPGGGYGPSTGPHPRDVIRTPAFKSSRAGCVYDKIGGAYKFQGIIKDYQNNGGTVNLTFDIGQTSDPTWNAETKSAYPYTDVTTIVDVDYLASSARTVEIARTLYHEAIHAKIFSYLRKIGGYEGLNVNNFPSLYNAYVDYISTGSKSTAGSAAQHEYMAQRYIDLIAKGVQQFDTRNHNNPEITLEHYRALAWVGLNETKAYNALTSAKRKDIDDKRKFLLDHFGAINCQ